MELSVLLVVLPKLKHGCSRLIAPRLSCRLRSKSARIAMTSPNQVCHSYIAVERLQTLASPRNSQLAIPDSQLPCKNKQVDKARRRNNHQQLSAIAFSSLTSLLSVQIRQQRASMTRLNMLGHCVDQVKAARRCIVCAWVQLAIMHLRRSSRQRAASNAITNIDRPAAVDVVPTFSPCFCLARRVWLLLRL